MKLYIAYFDFLGYKNFILNNGSEHLHTRVGHILRDIETSLSLGNLKKNLREVFIADLSNSHINCFNFSDTVLFWTNDNSIESFTELLKVSYRFNWNEVCYNFPVRGTIIFDEFEQISGSNENQVGGTYVVKCIYGKGLLKAYQKTENLNWAGCVIDNSVISELKNHGDYTDLLNQYAIEYSVPYKITPQNHKPEYALRLVDGKINKTAFKNRCDGIVQSFSSDSKDADQPRAKTLLDNTIKFLECVIE